MHVVVPSVGVPAASTRVMEGACTWTTLTQSHGRVATWRALEDPLGHTGPPLARHHQRKEVAPRTRMRPLLLDRPIPPSLGCAAAYATILFPTEVDDKLSLISLCDLVGSAKEGCLVHQRGGHNGCDKLVDVSLAQDIQIGDDLVHKLFPPSPACPWRPTRLPPASRRASRAALLTGALMPVGEGAKAPTGRLTAMDSASTCVGLCTLEWPVCWLTHTDDGRGCQVPDRCDSLFPPFASLPPPTRARGTLRRSAWRFLCHCQAGRGVV
jgi:hypothetical protein